MPPDSKGRLPRQKQRLKPRLDIHSSFLCEQSMQQETPEQHETSVSHLFQHLCLPKMGGLNMKSAIVLQW